MQQLTVAGAAYTQGHAPVVGEERKRVAQARIAYSSVSPSLLWLSPWVGGVRRLPALSRPLVTYKVRGRATRQQMQSQPLISAFHQFVEKERHLVDRLNPYWIPGGGWSGLTFPFLILFFLFSLIFQTVLWPLIIKTLTLLFFIHLPCLAYIFHIGCQKKKKKQKLKRVKTQTAANIKFPGYTEYTINFKYYSQWSFLSIREKRYTWNVNYANIIPIISNRECARSIRDDKRAVNVRWECMIGSSKA